MPNGKKNLSEHLSGWMEGLLSHLSAQKRVFGLRNAQAKAFASGNVYTTSTASLTLEAANIAHELLLGEHSPKADSSPARRARLQPMLDRTLLELLQPWPSFAITDVQRVMIGFVDSVIAPEVNRWKSIDGMMQWYQGRNRPLQEDTSKGPDTLTDEELAEAILPGYFSMSPDEQAEALLHWMHDFQGEIFEWHRARATDECLPLWLHTLGRQLRDALLRPERRVRIRLGVPMRGLVTNSTLVSSSDKSITLRLDGSRALINKVNTIGHELEGVAGGLLRPRDSNGDFSWRSALVHDIESLRNPPDCPRVSLYLRSSETPASLRFWVPGFRDSLAGLIFGIGAAMPPEFLDHSIIDQLCEPPPEVGHAEEPEAWFRSAWQLWIERVREARAQLAAEVFDTALLALPLSVSLAKNRNEHAIHRALKQIGRAWRSKSDHGLSVVFSVSAIECLLAEGKEGLADRVSQRVAVLLVDDPAERGAVKSVIKKLYDKRSKVVHEAGCKDVDEKSADDCLAVASCVALFAARWSRAIRKVSPSDAVDLKFRAEIDEAMYRARRVYESKSDDEARSLAAYVKMLSR